LPIHTLLIGTKVISSLLTDVLDVRLRPIGLEIVAVVLFSA